jgi:hypothetical protein
MIAPSNAMELARITSDISTVHGDQAMSSRDSAQPMMAPEASRSPAPCRPIAPLIT